MLYGGGFKTWVEDLKAVKPNKNKQSISINIHLINTKKWAALGADAIDPLLFLDQHIPLLIQQMLTE